MNGLIKSLTITGVLTCVSPLVAAMPAMRFDTASVVECRDVTSEPFAAAHPDQKIIEATFSISALVSSGREKDVTELFITIASPERRLKVFDYLPRTELSSDVSGPIETTTTAEKTKNAQVGLGGDVSGGCGPVTAHLTPSIGLGITKKDGTKETYYKLPPLAAVVTSGTTNGGHGAFFKLGQSSQVSLEGARDYTCQFIVPREWRGDWVAVRCKATGRDQTLFGTREEACGTAQMLVGLYLEGDTEALAVARRLGQMRSPESVASRSSTSREGTLGSVSFNPETWFATTRHVPDPRVSQRQALARLSGHKE